MGIVVPRPAMRGAERRLIEARLRAYDDARKCGFTCEEAMREAKAITSKQLARTPRTRRKAKQS